MSKEWKNELDLIDLWKKYEEDEITVSQLAGEVGNRLESIFDNFPDDERMNLGEIAYMLFELAEEGDAEEGDFDRVLEYLYDFGDRGKRLWIKTQEWQR